MSDTLQVQEIRNRIDQVLSTRHDELRERVRNCVAEVLLVDKDKVLPGASLIDNLGAESLDFLDLVFRLETDYQVKIPRDGLTLAARDGLGEHFDPGGVLSNQALERLRLLMPEVQSDRIAPGLRTSQIPNLFTAETFVRLVAWRLSEQQVSA